MFENLPFAFCYHHFVALNVVFLTSWWRHLFQLVLADLVKSGL